MKVWHLTEQVTYLLHGTSSVFLDRINQNGLVMLPIYLTDEEDIAEYYAEEVVEQHGGQQVILRIAFGALNPAAIEPDYPSIEEPLTYTLGVSEEEVWEEWEASNQTWQDSLNIVSSIRYRKPIPPEAISEF